MLQPTNRRPAATVIGGSGFLGSHVADQLTETGWSVTIYDRAPSPWLREGQLMIVGDLMSLESLERAIAGSSVVYHFAALADLNEALHRPIETVQTNVLGTVHALEAARLHSVARFVFASTVYVYSRQGGFYRCSKQAGEHYVEEYQRTYGLDYTILRYGSLYGPRAGAANPLFRIIRGALETGTLTYRGSPEALREYIHVHDAARASVVALEDSFRNQSVVLTGQEPMRVDDVLKMLAEILGMAPNVEYVDGDETLGHYVRTPYAYQPKLGRKYVPPLHVDLGQGLLQLIDEVRSSMSPVVT